MCSFGLVNRRWLCAEGVTGFIFCVTYRIVFPFLSGTKTGGWNAKCKCDYTIKTLSKDSSVKECDEGETFRELRRKKHFVRFRGSLRPGEVTLSSTDFCFSEITREGAMPSEKSNNLRDAPIELTLK